MFLKPLFLLSLSLGRIGVTFAHRWQNGGSDCSNVNSNDNSGASSTSIEFAAGASSTSSPTSTFSQSDSQTQPSTTSSTAVSSVSASTSTNSSSSGKGGANGIAAALGTTGGSGASAQTSSGETTLDSGNIQSASDSDGQASEEAGQSPSATDPANFINFCTGKAITNGKQVTAGSCNGIVMGDIPSSSNMISSILTNPGPGDIIAANQEFNVNVQVSNLEAGSFTNPNTTYYAAPQALKNGIVVGHTHITIQDLGGNIATSTPPDPSKFVFFKGVNDDGNGKGGLTATVAGGLPAGVYRVCTMTSASNHQPVLMPVAQRGAQDDCNKFTVSDSGVSNSNTGNQGSSATSGTNGGTSVTTAASNSPSSSSTSGKAGGNDGQRGRRVAARQFVA